jgi:hypothetical protein
MRILASVLLACLFPGMASSQEWCSEPICARFEGTDAIRIRAPGRFEITFTKAEGFGEEVYDIEADPDELYDLSALLPENGILWTKVTEVGDDGSYYANHATDLELLEPGGMRVRVRHSGKHQRYGIAGTDWNDLGYVQTFTVYATGDVYVDYALLAARDIPLLQFTLIVKTTGDWAKFTTEKLAGTLILPGGKQVIAVRATTMPAGAVMNLKQVKLTPTK